MRPSFDKATWRLNPADILTSEEPPLERFVMPDFMHEFYTGLKEQQGALGRDISGGFLHGGAIPDLHNGKRPKDFDVYVCIPEFLTALKKAYSPDSNDPIGLLKKTERVEHAMGRNFPLVIVEDLPRPNNNFLFGDFVEMEGYFYRGDKHYLFDLRIGSEPLTMENFLSWVHAPCMAVAASLEEGGGFAHHKDMADHLERKIMRIEGKVPDALVRKAARKGMSIETLPPS